MAALVNALDNYTPYQYGENGHLEYGWSNNIQEKILQFSFQVTRTIESGVKNLSRVLDELLSNLKYKLENGTLHEREVAKGYLSVLYRMIGHTRDIVDGKGDDNNIGSDNFRDILAKLRKDENVKAVVLRVNSPGGSALASDVIWREVDLIRKTKPIVVSMGDYAASGGYFISCAATKIFSEANTLTGSIGVFGMYPNTQHLMEDKLGIYTDGVKTNHFADMGDITRPVRDDERLIIQAGVDSIYSQFKHRVADGRHLELITVDSIAQGRVWTGTQALDLGLVDSIGGLQEAIHAAMMLAKIQKNDYRIVNYPEPDSQMKQISEIFSSQEKINDALHEQLGVYADYMQTLLQLKNFTGVQARLPFVIDMN